MTERVPCPLCGTMAHRAYRRVAGWRLVTCQGCGMVYLSPRPSAEARARLYDSDYFARRDMTDEDTEAGVLRQGERLAIVEAFARGRRLLDVGCGNGYFLELARRSGYHVGGVDVSADAAKYVKEQFGIDVFRGDLEDAPFENGSFDVVTLWHNLEHCASPVRLMKRITGLLDAGGVCVIRVPDVESFDSHVMRGRFEDFSVPHHLCHFTSRTLRALLARVGLDVLWVDHRLPKAAIGVLTTARRLLRGRTSYAEQRPSTGEAGRSHVLDRGVKARVLRAASYAVRGRHMTFVAARTGRG